MDRAVTSAAKSTACMAAAAALSRTDHAGTPVAIAKRENDLDGAGGSGRGGLAVFASSKQSGGPGVWLATAVGWRAV
jgi:hypothetical protein